MARVGLDIRKWAIVGAQQRLDEIAAETAAIRRIFPELRAGLSRSIHAVASQRQPHVARQKRTMSAEARARISAAQKARWAKQKSEATQTSASATSRKKK